MELRQLKYFVTAAQLGNLTKAAAAHYVSQPNITVAIRKLEEEVGTPLLIRHYKRVTLTPAGKRLYEVAQSSLMALDNVVAEIIDSRAKEKGTVTIGIPPMIGSSLLGPLTTYFRNHHPQWELLVVEDGSVGLRQRLLRHELDVAIVIIDSLGPSIDVAPLYQAAHKLCVPCHHPFAQRQHIPFQDLHNEPLIMMRLDSFHRKRIMAECQKAGFTPSIALSSNHIYTNIDSVANGIGLSFILDTVPLQRNDVVLVSTDPPLNVTVGIAWPHGKYISSATKDIITYVKGLYEKNTQATTTTTTKIAKPTKK